MVRMVIGITAAALVGATSVHAADRQERKPREKEVRVRLTGCLAVGETGGFLLKNATPMMSPREQRMMNPMSGGVVTDIVEPKTYDLVVPENGPKLGAHVGHRVEIDGFTADTHHGAAHSEKPDPQQTHAPGHEGHDSSEVVKNPQLRVRGVEHMSPTCS